MAFGPVNVGQAQEEKDFLTSGQVGVPGGLAQLDENGKLVVSQRPEVDAYTRAQTDELVHTAVSSHNTNTAAHPDIRSSVADLRTSVQALELKFGTNVNENPFTVTFGTLDEVDAAGVWNQPMARIEF